jgi:hypothetical protein
MTRLLVALGAALMTVALVVYASHRRDPDAIGTRYDEPDEDGVPPLRWPSGFAEWKTNAARQTAPLTWDGVVAWGDTSASRAARRIA